MIPTERNIDVFTTGPTFHYTTVLNMAFLVLAVLPVSRFPADRGPEMLKTDGSAQCMLATTKHMTRAPDDHLMRGLAPTGAQRHDRRR